MDYFEYIPESKNELDVKICEKKNEIQRIKKEIEELELQKSKQNDNYVGRVFEMNGLEYIYVTSIDRDGKMYGIELQDFEYSVEIYRCVVFELDDVQREVSFDEVRNIFRESLRWDKLKELLD